MPGRYDSGAGSARENHTQELVNQIAAAISGATGAEFFDSLVAHLAKTLGADYAFIGELLPGSPERVRTLTLFANGQKGENFEYDLANTPCENVVNQQASVFPAGVRQLFPADPLLEEMGAESYAATPLLGSKHQVLGLMATVFRRPLTEAELAKSELKIFAARAAAELERKQVEEKLRESERRYRDFIAQTSDGVWRTEFDPPVPMSLPREQRVEATYRNGYIAECNEAFARMRGFTSAGQLAGRPVRDVLPFAEWKRFAEKSCGEGSSFEIAMEDWEGKPTYTVRTLTAIVEGGMLRRVWGTTRDITATRRTEEALRESERRYRELLETVHLAAVMLDPSGKVSFCNEYLIRLTGWTEGEVTGADWFETFVPVTERAQARRIFDTAMKEGRISPHQDASIVTRTGAVRHVGWDSTLLRRPDGRVAGAASIGRDTTEQRALEEQYRQAQKLESIGRLAGGIAHDFNNLLTIINGYSELILSTLPKDDPTYINVSEIANAGQKAAGLTQQLLAFSRRQVLETKVLDVNAIIASAEKMLRRLIGEDVRLITDLDSSLGSVRADAGQLYQVLINLAVNARDAMPSGGMLTIKSSNLDVNQFSKLAQAGIGLGRYVLLSVSDTGTGMDAETKAHVFEPFFTTKKAGEGTGLGLATVYGIVRQSGGHILIDTAPGRGTTFEIFLPLVEEKAQQADGNDAGAVFSPGTETILVVEDQHEVRDLVVRMLRSFGYRVLEAADGEEALEISRRRNGSIHLMITDVVMPGISGYELADRLKPIHPETEVLWMSGYTQVRAGDGVHPADRYIQKPFTAGMLAAKVREILGQRR